MFEFQNYILMSARVYNSKSFSTYFLISANCGYVNAPKNRDVHQRCWFFFFPEMVFQMLEKYITYLSNLNINQNPSGLHFAFYRNMVWIFFN